MAMYHSGNRDLQDQFGSTQLADRLVEKLWRDRFKDEDKAFIESVGFFFLATADGQGRPDCSFKGGPPGFVRIAAPDLLIFPDYDGNGMFKSLGNIKANPQGRPVVHRDGRRAQAAARERARKPCIRRSVDGGSAGRANHYSRRAGKYLSELSALYSGPCERRAVRIFAGAKYRAQGTGLERI